MHRFDTLAAEIVRAVLSVKRGAISAWSARHRDAGKRWACVFCALLTIGFNAFDWRRATKDHCTDALG